jgi:hypothetical protein
VRTPSFATQPPRLESLVADNGHGRRATRDRRNPARLWRWVMFRFATLLALIASVAVGVGMAPAGIDGSLYVTNNSDKVVSAVYLNGHEVIADVDPNTSPGARIWDDPKQPAHLRAVSADGTREWTYVLNSDVSNYTWTLDP